MIAMPTLIRGLSRHAELACLLRRRHHSQVTRQQLQRGLDLEAARLSDEPR
jgi:hypothetical protein